MGAFFAIFWSLSGIFSRTSYDAGGDLESDPGTLPNPAGQEVDPLPGLGRSDVRLEELAHLRRVFSA